METLTIKRESLNEFTERLSELAEIFGGKANTAKAKGDNASLLYGEYYNGCAVAFDSARELFAGYLKVWEKEQEE